MDNSTELPMFPGWDAWLRQHGIEPNGVIGVKLWPATRINVKGGVGGVKEKGWYLEIQRRVGAQDGFVLELGTKELAVETSWVKVKTFPENV